MGKIKRENYSSLARAVSLKTMNKKTVLLILVDGMRHDYINPVDSPFLDTLRKQNIDAVVRETFAFELRPAFFAGLQPEECDIANMFYYNPVDSPFRSIDIRHEDRSRISRDVRAEGERRGYNLVKYVGNPAEIPLKLLKYFDFSEKYHTTDPLAITGHKTLFDYLRNDGKRWLWIAYPEGPGTTKGVLEQFLSSLNSDLDFIYLHFSELDWVGHEYGPFSKEQKATLREIDQAVMEIFKKVNQRFSQVRSIIFGDHGQVEIKENIDIETMLKETNLQIEKDYIYFLDSTQARFWFFNEIAKRRVTELLASASEGRILTHDDYKRLHFSFKHNKFGDLIFVVNDGIGIFPNYFQRSIPCKGLHGYLPEVTNNWAKLIITGCGVKEKIVYPIEMVDIFPTLLDLLNYEKPRDILAKSVFGRNNTKISNHNFKISIVMPTYNRINTLRKSIKAIESQTYPKEEFELIVVNDGSKDGTIEFLKEYSINTALNFRHFDAGHSGPAAARNIGIRAAEGEIILLIGDDMLAEPDFLNNHITFHTAWPELNHACLGLITWPIDIKVTPLMEFITSKEGALQFDYESIMESKSETIESGFFWSSNVSFKRLFALTHGLFNDEVFKHAMWEDIELGCRLGQAGLLIHFRQKCKVYHEHDIKFEEFAERQRLVGWYSEDMLQLGISTRYSARRNENDRIYSKLALGEIITTVAIAEKECLGGDLTILKRLYKSALHYAAMVGYSERQNTLKEDCEAVTTLLNNLALADHEINEMNNQVREMNNQLRERNDQIHSVLNSKSWKITMPLRRLYTMYLKVRRK